MRMGFYRSNARKGCVVAICCVSFVGFSYGQCPILVPGEQYPGTLDSHDIVTGDFNGDPMEDVAIVVNEGFVQVHIALADGGYALEDSYQVGTAPADIAAGDLNADPYTDLVVTNRQSNSISILYGNGDGTFAPAVHHGVGRYPIGLVLADLTGNGWLDIAVACGGQEPEGIPGAIAVLLNGPAGIGTANISYLDVMRPHSIAAADFDGDGDMDLAASIYNQDCAAVFLGDNQGNFPFSAAYYVGYYPYHIVTTDLDGDGRQDIAVSNAGDFQLQIADTRVTILRGQGNGAFAPWQVLPPIPGLCANFPIALDVNLDGYPDLVVEHAINASNPIAPPALSVYLGSADGTLAPPASEPVKCGRVHGLAAGDLDGDRITDFAVACRDGGFETLSVAECMFSRTRIEPVPGAAGSFYVVLVSVIEFRGIAIALVAEGGAVRIADVRPGPDVPAGASFLAQIDPADQCGLGATSGAIAGEAHPQDTQPLLPPGTYRLFEITLARSDGASTGSCADLKFVDDCLGPALAPIDNVITTAENLSVPVLWCNARVCLREKDFVRSDANDSSGQTDISDAISVLSYLFAQTPFKRDCLDAADANDSGAVDIADPIFILTYLFARGPVPPPPFPARGFDPTPDPLLCDPYIELVSSSCP